jgi:hypothetical protein
VPRGPAKKKKISASSAGGVMLRGLNFIFDAFGVTRPLRLGLALGLSFALELVVPWANLHGFPSPPPPTLATALFGVSFCLLFGPLLLWPGLPDSLKELLVVLELFAKKSGLSEEGRQKLYFGALEAIVFRNKELQYIDFKPIKEEYEKRITEL